MQTTTTITDAKILGTTDAVGTCDCCGRTDLKKTVVLDFGSDIRHYGSECAAHATERPAKEIKVTARSADDLRRAEQARVRGEQERSADAAFQSFLDRCSSKIGRALQLQELGGFRAARDLFAMEAK